MFPVISLNEKQAATSAATEATNVASVSVFYNNAFFGSQLFYFHAL